MILVDTSVWVNHFRKAEPRLQELLVRGQVGVHPFVVGELACGSLRKRAETLRDFGKMSVALLASDAEARHLLESRRLWGKGLGWVDIHLLASALFSGWPLWTADHALAEAAHGLGVAFP